MPNWTHRWDSATGTHHWFECDGSGRLLRQASFAAELPRTELPPSVAEFCPSDEPFAGCEAAAATAADRSELAWMRTEFGRFGVELYEARHGILLDAGGVEHGVRLDGSGVDGSPVTEAEFERVWRQARRDRNFTRITTGPLPFGLRLSGTVSALPWGAGITGLFVELGLPIAGFVDMVQLPREPELWPSVGAVGEYEVVDVRLNCHSDHRGQPQVRLRPRPAAAPGSAPPSPRPGPP